MNLLCGLHCDLVLFAILMFCCWCWRACWGVTVCIVVWIVIVCCEVGYGLICYCFVVGGVAGFV